jgi:hypothetical protein
LSVTNFIQLQNAKPPIKNWWLLLLLTLLFVPHLYISYQWMLGSQTPDLHIRILGTRLLEAYKNPYTYYWQPGDSIFLYNPNLAIYSSANGVTSTPFVLWLQKPFASLSFCHIKIIWWSIEEFFLLATIWLNMLLVTKRGKQFFMLVFIAIFFLYSRNWWLHIYNGQMYILYAFVFSVVNYFFSYKHKNIAVWLYPIISLVRPFFGIALLPLLTLKRKMVMLFLVSLSAAFFLFTLSSNLTIVRQYSNAMKIYATEETGAFDSIARNKLLINTNYPTENCVAKDPNQNSGLNAGCLYSLQHYLVRLGIKINDANIYALVLAILIVLTLVANKKRSFAKSNEQQLLLSFLLYLLCEFITPASRNPYSLVQYLGCLALVVNALNTRWLVLLLIGFALNHDFPFRFTYQREIGELLILVCYMAALFTKPVASYSTSTKQSLKV